MRKGQVLIGAAVPALLLNACGDPTDEDSPDLAYGPETEAQAYVLRSGEGEALGDNRLIKASPNSGTKAAVVVLDQLQPSFTTGPDFHRHDNADEVFYVISGKGAVTVSDQEHALAAGDIAFVPNGMNHIISVSSDGPMELLFFLDEPGLDEWFRLAHAQYFSTGTPLTAEACNEIGDRLAMTCVARD